MSKTNSTRRAPNFKDLTGKQFGKWTVIKESVDYPSEGTYWLCRCTCGTEKSVKGTTLGKYSHGCKACSKRQHGMIDTPEYAAWKAMKQRCNNQNVKAFPYYGGNGITICERWQESFENFYADMGQKPSESHSNDRIDGSKGYEPGNCRWATTEEQARNTSRNRLITYMGNTMCLAAWAAEVGIKYQTLYGRILSGWSIERALTEPVKAKS